MVLLFLSLLPLFRLLYIVCLDFVFEPELLPSIASICLSLSLASSSCFSSASHPRLKPVSLILGNCITKRRKTIFFLPSLALFRFSASSPSSSFLPLFVLSLSLTVCLLHLCFVLLLLSLPPLGSFCLVFPFLILTQRIIICNFRRIAVSKTNTIYGKSTLRTEDK